ncbi:TPA: hypothetical protein L5692_006039 [Pseudomonas aeruginosa]|nr:hypothetical protein [Pseudomonas aeruginosa]
MVKGGTRPYRDLILRDRLGHAGVKVKWEPVEARHGVNAQADAQQGIPDWIRCYPTPP